MSIDGAADTYGVSRPTSPVLTVRSDSSQRSFATGHDVVVGSDLRADMRVAHPLVTRAHLLLRFDQGRWLAVDNDSPNGMFVDGRRVPVVDIRDGQSINIGKPDGPRLTFALGQHQGAVGQLPPTVNAVPIITPPADPRPSPPSSAQRAGVSSPPLRAGHPRRFSAPPGPTSRRKRRLRPAAHNRPGPWGKRPARGNRGNRVSGSQKPSRQTLLGPPTCQSKRPSRCARLRFPTKAETRPAKLHHDRSRHRQRHRHHRRLGVALPRVLGPRLPSAPKSTTRTASTAHSSTAPGSGRAVLTEGDVVTIGNVDLVFTGGMLVRRTEAATRTGGLEVREVGFSVDGKRLARERSR